MNAATAAGFALAVVVGLSAAVAGERVVSRQGRTDRVTVIYWEKWTGAEGDAMQKVVNDFNRSQDKIFVKYLSISGVDTKTLLATSGGDPPDVAGIWQEQVAQFADAHALTDLTPYAKKNGVGPSYYIPAYWNPLVYHGRLWALPSTPASIALHVRPDLVPREIATPGTFPKTIEELDAYSNKYTVRKPDGTIETAFFVPSDPGWWNYAWGPLFGGKLVDGDRLTINSPENLRAFEWLAGYAKRFGGQQLQQFQSGLANFSSPEDPFMSGKVMTEINGTWKGQYINVYKPGLKWFAVPFPYPSDRPDLAGHTITSQDILVIPHGAKHPQEAFEFIKYIQRQDVMEGLCIAHGKNSPLEHVSEHFFATNPNKYIRLFDELPRHTSKVITTPVIGIWRQMGDDISNAFQEVYQEGRPPKEALDAAQARVQGEWDTYKKQVLGQ